MMDEQIPTPGTAVPETAQMGMVARFISVFTDPKRAFLTIRKNHEWLVVLVLVSVLGLATYQLTRPIIRKDVIADLEETLKSNPNITEERREEIIESVAARFDNPVWQLVGPVFQLLAMVVVSAILLFLGNIILGGQTKFLYVLNMYALTLLIMIPESIVKVPLMISKESTKVQTSLALFVSSESANTFLGTLLGKFDLFGLWQLVLIILGLSVLCRTPVSKSAWAVGIVWFIWVVIQAGLASLGIRMGM